MSEKEMSNQPILVTGAHRSGTTWVGKILCASGEAAYISEPLNLWHRPGVMRKLAISLSIVGRTPIDQILA
jgi:LPS sulfotransferase NodH